MLSEILRVEGLSKDFIKNNLFGSRTSMVKAIEDVTFSLHDGEVLVVAGESGSGKSTLAKLILGAITPDMGKIIFDGEEIGICGIEDEGKGKLWIRGPAGEMAMSAEASW